MREGTKLGVELVAGSSTMEYIEVYCWQETGKVRTKMSHVSQVSGKAVETVGKVKDMVKNSHVEQCHEDGANKGSNEESIQQSHADTVAERDNGSVVNLLDERSLLGSGNDDDTGLALWSDTDQLSFEDDDKVTKVGDR